MNLEREVNRLFSATAKADLDILPSIAAAEEFLKESYEGRYYFELIQNARDANRALNMKGTILIQLSDYRLSIWNTGAPFSQAGVASICRIGQSDKASQDFIGHKGIGFKSVQEITERPTVVTEFGTLYFDRWETLNQLEGLHPGQPIEPDQIPLFFFPHFARTTLNHMNFVTRIDLPFRDGVSTPRVFDDFSQIGEKQLVLLGSISEIRFSSDMGDIRYEIESKPRSQFVEVRKNCKSTFFKVFQPRKPTKLPDTVYAELEKREKDLFKTDRNVEIRILLEWDKEQRRPLCADGAKLYLFYPLEITSGFRFLIHSYFSVNPERKDLRKTALNRFILSEIAQFISGQFVQDLKRSNRSSLLDIVRFKRIPDSGLDKLYDEIVSRLQDTRFIYDGVTKQFYTPAEVMVADGSHRELFPEGEFAGKRLIFVESDDVSDWLTEELMIPYLTDPFISQHIEEECMKQRKRRNTEFFQSLYAYAAENGGLDLHGKRVLLTEHWGLVDDSVDVFYGGVKRQVSLPKSLRKRITFIHRDVEISDFRDGRSRTGIIEFSTHGLVTKLLKLFDDPQVDHVDIVRTLKALDLDRVDKKSIPDVVSKIRVPVKGESEWLNPLHSPIYFDSAGIRGLFPKARFLDLQKLAGSDHADPEWSRFLKKVNIWDRPALYLRDYQLDQSDPRNDALEQYTGKYSKPFTVVNDRCLDSPVGFSRFFYESVVEHWDDYVAYIEDSDLPEFRCRSYYSDHQESIVGQSKIALTHFVRALRSEAWIWIGGRVEPVGCSEAVAINPHDSSKAHLQVLKRYLSIVALDYSAKQNMVTVLNMNHLSRPCTRSILSVMELMRDRYPDPPQSKDFTDCFNRILAFLFDFYSDPGTDRAEVISKLRGTMLLALDEISGRTRWESADSILYIDDVPLYIQLPSEIRSWLQPVFTNRDRNTFGRIASQIGRVLSRSVQKEILAPVDIDRIPLSRFMVDLYQLIASLESYIQRPLSDTEVIDMGRTQIIDSRDFKTRVIIEGYEDGPITLDEDFAIERSEHQFGLYVESSKWWDITVKAQALTGLFAQILDQDLGPFSLYLGAILRQSTSERQRALIDHGMSSERVSEIRTLLEQQVFSTVEQFWKTILQCKNIAASEKHVGENTLDLCWLADKLVISEEELRKIHSLIDYDNLSDPDNIDAMECLFGLIDIGLEDFYRVSYIRITFKRHHDQQLAKLRNRLEPKFESYIHNRLSKLSYEERSKFLALLEQYRRVEPEVDENAIKLDYDKVFDDTLNERFLKWRVSLMRLRNQRLRKGIGDIFYSNKKRLLSELKKARLPTDYVEEYLNDSRTRSRLYFDFDQKHIADYRTRFKKEIGAATSGRGKQPHPMNLEAYRDSSNQEIEDYQSKSTAVRRSSGRASRGGWGWTPPDRDREVLVGRVGEWSVFQKLLGHHPSAKWMSKFAYEAGMNPEGSDGLGYDIEYIDGSGNKTYVEVKSTEGGDKSFKVTPNEIAKAHEARDSYHIIFVSYALDNDRRSYRNLGNIFMYEDNEDFTNNSKFRAVNEEYRIVFE